MALTTINKMYRRHKCRLCYRATKNILRKKNRDWIVEYKKKHECAKCKIGNYRVLEFHHLNKNKKDFSISSAYNNMGLKQTKEEIAKCVILCANCHRITHYEKGGW